MSPTDLLDILYIYIINIFSLYLVYKLFISLLPTFQRSSVEEITVASPWGRENTQFFENFGNELQCFSGLEHYDIGIDPKTTNRRQTQCVEIVENRAGRVANIR